MKKYIKERLIIGGIMAIIALIVIAPSKCNAQSEGNYKYYLFAIAITAKGEIVLGPDKEKYDIDTAYSGKKFDSYSQIFNLLSGLGLEYVNQFSTANFVSLSTNARFDYMVWRRRK